MCVQTYPEEKGFYSDQQRMKGGPQQDQVSCEYIDILYENTTEKIRRKKCVKTANAW